MEKERELKKLVRSNKPFKCTLQECIDLMLWGWDFCRPYRVKLLGEKLKELFEKVPELLNAEVTVNFHNGHTGSGPNFRYHYCWTITFKCNLPEIPEFPSSWAKGENFIEVGYSW